jgi:hypothetical protein
MINSLTANIQARNSEQNKMNSSFPSGCIDYHMPMPYNNSAGLTNSVEYQQIQKMMSN